MKACNALSIAEACKLPRETVRCEVVHLIEHGYVYRNAQGHLYLAGNRWSSSEYSVVTILVAG